MYIKLSAIVLSYPFKSLFNYNFFIKDIRQLFNDELDNVDTANEPIDVDNEPPASTALIEELNEAADEITGMIDNTDADGMDAEAATTAQGEFNEKDSTRGDYTSPHSFILTFSSYSLA